MKKRKKSRHLRLQDRDRMEALLDAGEKQCEIAKILKVDPGTICRERKRKRKNGRYDALTAHMKANAKRGRSKYRGMKIEGKRELKAHVVSELKRKRSPDEIAGRMKREHKPFYASKNAIYRWLYSVWGQRYCPLLCTKRYRARKRKTPAIQRALIPHRIGIAERPAGATNKTRYGHFEGDTAVAPKRVASTAGIALAAERISKLLVGGKIASQSPRHMTHAVQHMQEKANIDSMTLDNGIENTHHEAWGIPTYFADPHSPWQKPVIENAIGLLRRWFFKKGTDWSLVSESEFQTALLVLNGKYRKSLRYQNALEVARAHGILKENSGKMKLHFT